MERDACWRHLCTGENNRHTQMYLSNAADWGWCPQCLVGKPREGCPMEKGTALWPGLCSPGSNSPDPPGTPTAQSWQDAAESSLLSLLREAATSTTQKRLKSSLRGCCHSTCFHLQSMFPTLYFYGVIIILEFKDNLGNEAK